MYIRLPVAVTVNEPSDALVEFGEISDSPLTVIVAVIVEGSAFEGSPKA
jgi:hypothetical protein